MHVSLSAFADELQLWEELGVQQVGVITAKVEAYGRGHGRCRSCGDGR